MKPLKVALYTGVVFERDAVSRSFLWKLELLQRLRAAGFPIEVTGFTQASDADDVDLRVIGDITGLLRDPFFTQADLHIFEYGMCYDLFNVLMLLDRPSLVIDHNTTPPALVTDPVVQRACAKAEVERHNLFLASHVATDSEFSRNALLNLGMDPDGVTVLHLPATNSFVGRSEHTFTSTNHGDEVRLTYVGRLVKAKGLEELLAALRSFWDTGDKHLHLTIAGSLRFSDPEVVDALYGAIALYGTDERLTLELDASDQRIAELYGSTDIFVMPSHHEGYCIPIVEAMMSGCYIVGSDAGNIPVVMGGLGTEFRVGDAEHLASSIGNVVGPIRRARGEEVEFVVPTSRGEMSLTEWHKAVAAHLSEYSTLHYEMTFLRIVHTLFSKQADTHSEWLTLLDSASEYVSQSPT